MCWYCFVVVSVEVVDEVVDIVVPAVDAIYDNFMFLLVIVMVPLYWCVVVDS